MLARLSFYIWQTITFAIAEAIIYLQQVFCFFRIADPAAHNGRVSAFIRNKYIQDTALQQ